MRTTSAQIFTKEKDDAAAAAATAVLAASPSAVPSAPPLPPQSPPSPALTSSFSTPPSTPKQPPSPTLDLTPSGAAASSGAATSGAVSPLAAAEPPLDQTNLEDDPEMVTQPTQIPDPDSLPQLSTIFQTYKPTLSWVPAAVSADFSREFGSIAEKLAADTEAIHLWKMFFMFPFVILTGGRKDKRARRPGGGLSQVQLLKE